MKASSSLHALKWSENRTPLERIIPLDRIPLDAENRRPESILRNRLRLQEMLLLVKLLLLLLLMLMLSATCPPPSTDDEVESSWNLSLGW